MGLHTKGLEQFRYISLRAVSVKLLFVAGVFVCVKSIDDYTQYYALFVGAIIVNALITSSIRGASPLSASGTLSYGDLQAFYHNRLLLHTHRDVHHLQHRLPWHRRE